MDSRYDQLKKKIQEANPEIMELKFGCEIKIIPGSRYSELVAKHWGTEMIHDGRMFVNATANVSMFEFLKHRKEYKVIGRPIRLSDVLITVHSHFATEDHSVMIQATGQMHIVHRAVYDQKYKTPKRYDQQYGSKPEGSFITAREGWSYDIMEISSQWNLKDDNLDHQPEETKTFLMNLLKIN